jgi:site-specific recombinase XerD
MTNYVFTFRGKSIRDLRTAFYNACKRAGIKNLRFHDVRHTFATRLVHSGIDLATVSKLLGHSTIHMTMRYSHPNPEAFKSAVQSLHSLKSKKVLAIPIAVKLTNVESIQTIR